MKDTYVKINVKETVRARLKELASVNGMTLADYLESISKPTLDTPTPTQVDLVDKLDYEAEHPESSLPPEDAAILANLAPGELPTCCQEIFDDPEHPVPTCKHWRKAYENYYGQRMWGYVNDLVGGGYRTWFSKYVK